VQANAVQRSIWTQMASVMQPQRHQHVACDGRHGYTNQQLMNKTFTYQSRTVLKAGLEQRRLQSIQKLVAEYGGIWDAFCMVENMLNKKYS
jgi:hypothetical protein